MKFIYKVTEEVEIPDSEIGGLIKRSFERFEKEPESLAHAADVLMQANIERLVDLPENYAYEVEADGWGEWISDPNSIEEAI